MASTKVASIGVGKLTSTDLYVDKFLVEIYSDSGFTTKIGQSAAAAAWSGTQWVQKEIVLFDGLSFGTTYWLRANTVAPISGTLGTWKTFSIVAGSATAPNPTYTLVSQTVTVAGVVFIVSAASVPVDIEHFEYTYTTDGSTPASTAKPKGTLVQDGAGNLVIFAASNAAQTVQLYIRAVNTSQQVQAWTLFTKSIPTPSAPTVSQVAGPIFGGIQFTFLQLIPTNDVIRTYKIYRNTVNNSTTATLVDTRSHDPFNSGSPIVYQDLTVTATGTYYYWVSAVNDSGKESTLAAAGSAIGSFAVPVETINLFGNPAMQGSGNLSAVSNSPANQETWGYLNSGATVPSFRNNREIKIPNNTGTQTQIGQYKSISRFKDGQIVTISFRIRRGGNVTTPSGTFTLSVLKIDNYGNMITSIASPATAVSGLTASGWVLYRLTAQLNRVAGQGIWGFVVSLTDTAEDLFVAEPMLNIGSDSAPFTTNTFLSDVPQFAFEGANFLSDDFTDTAGTAITSHYPTAGGVGPHTGVGQSYDVLGEIGTSTSVTIQSGTARYAPTTGSLQTVQVVQPPETSGVTNYGTSAAQVAYAVQAGVHLGTFTTATTIESGVVARWTDINNFYLARLMYNGGTYSVDLFKRVAGAYTSLGTFAPGAINDATILLQVTDGTKVVIFQGTQRISSTDNALTAAGQAGFRLSMNATSFTVGPNVSGLTAWYVQNVSAPPAPPSSSNTPTAAPPPVNYNPSQEPGRLGGGVII